MGRWDYSAAPEFPEINAALRQARERAAANRPRPPVVPNPPDRRVSAAPTGLSTAGGAMAGAGRSNANPVVSGMNSPHRPPRSDLYGPSAEQHAAAVAAAAAGSMRHHYNPGNPHSHLMGPSPGTFNSHLEHMQLTDLHQRLLLQQRAGHAAMMATGRHPPHWASAAAAAAGRPSLEQHFLAEELDRMRAARGLPHMGAPVSAAGMGDIHHPGPGAAHVAPSAAARASIPAGREGAGGQAVESAAESGSFAVESRGAAVEQGRKHDDASTPVVAAAAPPPPPPPPPPTTTAPSKIAATAEAPAQTPSASGGNALFDLLATAAEDTLRREEMQKKAKDSKAPKAAKGKGTLKPAAVIGGGPDKGVAKAPDDSTNKKDKRKRKRANEPKNPLGAFVFYQRKIMAEVFEDNPLITFGEAAAECGKRWRTLPEDQKQEYKEMAAADKARYTRELASFKGKQTDLVVPVEAPKAPPLLAPKKRGRKKEEPVILGSGQIEPKKPKSALMYFRADEAPRVMTEFPHVSNADANRECSARWRGMSKKDRAKWEQMASDDKIRYKKELEELVKENDAEGEDGAGRRTRRAKLVEEEEDQIESSGVAGQLEDDVVDVSDGEEMEKAINHWSPEAVQIPTKVGYDNMVDTKPYYVEEEAWRYHNPPLPPSKTAADEEEVTDVNLFTYVTHEDLRPLPPPPPLPENFPHTPFCVWSFDTETRVLLADFRQEAGDPIITIEDEKFLLEMYERDDITVVSQGLVSGLNKEKWTLDMIERVAGDEYYHKFRKFEKPSQVEAANPAQKTVKKNIIAKAAPQEADEVTADVHHGEIDRCLSMKVRDYIAYLRHRGAVISDDATHTEDEDEAGLHDFTFKDHDGNEHTINVIKTVLYMIDFDMVKLAPTLHDDFVASFKLKSVLPGGSHCMMCGVNSNGRPFMGPNMYITPPGSFTHFHQDGHGTVDSGHVCLSGYNEVVMLRRLPERHKRHALRFLTGSYKNPREHTFEALYNLPHGDGLGDKPRWPDNEALQKCNEMNYCVSRFILQEGQCVHINKGRIHAFRKMTNEPLSPDDCHAKLRAELVHPGTTEKVVAPGKPEILCISVAWDWMYRGVTMKGINREIVSGLECAALNRKYGVPSLAIPELSLMQMARTLAPKPTEPTPQKGAYSESLVGFNGFRNKDCVGNRGTGGYMPTPSVICKGIFPALQYVVKQHIYAMNLAESLKSKSFERCKRVSVAARPNAWENPLYFALDPYGNNDFFCKLCKKELSNVYLHCDGCEILLSKDFNICLECHQEKRYVTSVQMHPLNNKRHSTINHIGNYTFDRASRCPCKNGPVCRHCNYCAGCSCRCHSWFTLHFRFFKKEDELKLLHRVKRMVGREQLNAAAEVEKRLSMAVKGYFDDRERTPFGLHGMDFLHPEADMVEEEDEEEDDEDSEEQKDEGIDPDDGPVAPSAPTRKSRRLQSIDEPEAETEKKPDTDSDSQEAPDSESGGLGERDVMDVDVDDMKVTIRFSSQKGTAVTSGSGTDQNGAEAKEITDSLSVRSTNDLNKASCVDDKAKEVSQPEVTDMLTEGTLEEKKLDSETETPLAKIDPTHKKPRRIQSGKWSEDERLLLKQALEKEPDWECVERHIGTRRQSQIKSHAIRQFPDLFKTFLRKLKGESEEVETEEPKKKGSTSRSALEATDGAQGDTPIVARRSSRRSAAAKSTPESTGVSEAASQGDEAETESDDEGQKISAREKKPSTRQANQPGGGRTRRATLSGGRKRQNSGGSTSTKQSEDLSAGESDPGAQPSDSRVSLKRQKVDD